MVGNRAYDRTSYILVVDDDNTLLKFFKIHLNKFFSRVIVVKNAKEAIETLREKEIDLVLTDIRMPFVDGISLLKYIKTFFPHIPVVVATAYPGDVGDIKPDALLCKPFGPERLTALIQTHFRHHCCPR